MNEQKGQTEVEWLRLQFEKTRNSLDRATEEKGRAERNVEWQREELEELRPKLILSVVCNLVLAVAGGAGALWWIFQHRP